MDNKIRIVIADGHKLFAEGLTSLLNTNVTEVTDVVGTASELTDLTYASYFHIVLIDMEFPGINGFDIITSIKKRCPQIKIIVLATHKEEHFVAKARRYGADGYLLKNVNKQDLLSVVSQIHSGYPHFPSQVNTNHTTYFTDNSILASYKLTKREKELLQFIKASQTNQEIAKKLSLNIYTIKIHRKNILQKLNLKNAGELKSFIREHNL